MAKEEINHKCVDRLIAAQRELLEAIDEAVTEDILVEIKPYDTVEGTQCFEMSIKKLIKNTL